MPFQPEKAGPQLLSAVHQILTEHGLNPNHIELCYDGQEDAQTYCVGHHFHPGEHEAGHSFNLARALRDCAPDSGNPNVNGLFVRYFNDGTMVVAPAVVGITDGDDPDEVDDDA